MHSWMRRIGTFAFASSVCLLIVSLAAGAQPKDTGKSAAKDVPVYKVDPFWPKTLAEQMDSPRHSRPW